MSWNFRVIREGDLYKVCEVYYDADGHARSWIEDKHPLRYVESLDDVRWVCEKLLAACDKPVLVQEENSLIEPPEEEEPVMPKKPEIGTSKLVTLWVISRNTDLTEGRGAVKPWKAFASKAKATEVALTAGVQGGRADRIDVQEGYLVKTGKDVRFFPVDAGLGYDDTPPSPETLKRVREEVIAKLTPLERMALGL